MVTESEYQAAAVAIKAANRAIGAAMIAVNANELSETEYQDSVAPHVVAAATAKAVCDEYWNQAPESFYSRQLLQQLDL